MKAVQVTLDEALLKELEANPEVQRDGRSAVLRRAAREYLARQRRAGIAVQYRQAYAGEAELRNEFHDWKDEGEWPTE